MSNAIRNRNNAAILALLGLLVSCIFSPFAIWQARKAQRGGVDAGAWEMAGWFGFIVGFATSIAWTVGIINVMSQ